MRHFKNISLTVSIFKEDDNFVAFSPALDLSTHGQTLAEAQDNFNEIVRIFFEELEERGNADEVLSSLGWAKIKNQYEPPVEVSHTISQFKVPVAA